MPINNTLSNSNGLFDPIKNKNSTATTNVNVSLPKLSSQVGLVPSQKNAIAQAPTQNVQMQSSSKQNPLYAIPGESWNTKSTTDTTEQ
jgi:hypothetical protein